MAISTAVIAAACDGTRTSTDAGPRKARSAAFRAGHGAAPDAGTAGCNGHAATSDGGTRTGRCGHSTASNGGTTAGCSSHAATSDATTADRGPAATASKSAAAAADRSAATTATASGTGATSDFLGLSGANARRDQRQHKRDRCRST
jgi:hypothetical protein